jgi:hypothetical protein
MISNWSFMLFLLDVGVNDGKKPELCACFCCVLCAVGRLALSLVALAQNMQLWGQLVVLWQVLHSHKTE